MRASDLLCRGLIVSCLVGGVSTPRLAEACGGLFCAVNLSPVDQNAEKILFEINPDDTVTAHVEISYSGTAAAFSWVVPVSDTPVLDVVPISTLQLLDAATRPVIIPPPTTCNDGFFFANDSLAGRAAAPEDGGVNVEDLPRVGPFEPTVISSTDPEALADWLDTNGYLITAEMRPFIADYVELGMKFLAMKLAPDAEVADIAPIKMTTPGRRPMVPIVLTSVAAEPEMGVIVLIAGEQRYEAETYHNFTIEKSQIRINPGTGQSNYFGLVSWQVDEHGGQAFVTELAAAATSLNDDLENAFVFPDDIEASRQYLQEVLTRHAFVTRLYTRISGWEMGFDPVFAPTSGGAVSNTFDFSDDEEIDICDDDLEPVPCGTTYCGVGSSCATTNLGVDGCVCTIGTVARAVRDPRGTTQVFCQEDSFDLTQSVAGAVSDPCAGLDCGNGTCVALNGTATCDCDNGFAGVADSNGRVACVKALKLFGPKQLLWPDRGCSCGAATVPVWAALGVLGLWRRRRARQA